MDTEAKLSRLKEILAEVADLSYANYVLEWDQQCYMPEGGAEARSQQCATLQRLAHEKLVAEETGRLLDDLKPHAATSNRIPTTRACCG